MLGTLGLMLLPRYTSRCSHTSSSFFVIHIVALGHCRHHQHRAPTQEPSGEQGQENPGKLQLGGGAREQRKRWLGRAREAAAQQSGVALPGKVEELVAGSRIVGSGIRRGNNGWCNAGPRGNFIHVQKRRGIRTCTALIGDIAAHFWKFLSL